LEEKMMRNGKHLFEDVMEQELFKKDEELLMKRCGAFGKNP